MQQAKKKLQHYGPVLRALVISITAFLTLVDLFATQAILPTLVAHYKVSPAQMGLAVNSSTMGMAIAGLVVAFLSRKINRRLGILLSLGLLSIPTLLLASAPNLEIFTILRIIQGLMMSTAFTLTLAYLAEHCSAKDAAGAFAAYITGNVASNFFGRLMSASLADHFGLATNFYVFAALNFSGAILVFFTLAKTPPMTPMNERELSALDSLLTHLRNPPLRTSFILGFLILFAFIGTFTYVNFVLVQDPYSIGQMHLGLVYFVFIPSIITTPLAGYVVARYGTRLSFWGGLIVALMGLPLLLVPSLSLTLIGLAMVGAGTFFAQATATGFVGRAATTDRGAASGIYLASYFLGGLAGSAILGQLFDRYGWRACVMGIGISLILSCLLAVKLKLPASAANPKSALAGER